MRPVAEFDEAMRYSALGLNDCAISRLTGIPRSTIRDWRAKGCPCGHGQCPMCDAAELSGVDYAYLLGLYLGDGCLSPAPRGVFKLRITLDQKYPGIIKECSEAMRAMRPPGAMSIGHVICPGCIEVNAHWKHWPCLFPQHGPGRKHLRNIELAEWQESIMRKHPGRMLRGLIHSDGYRGDNIIRAKGKTYIYPRYQFCNYSGQIREIFCRACDEYGVRWRQMNRVTVAVSRREDVSKLDEVIGRKR